MEYTIPHYYQKFKCIANDCPDTCCAGWQIVIDDETLDQYEHMTGPFATRLKNSVDWKEGCYLQNKGRCLFLNNKNLCDIYLETMDESNWCTTCKEYPRHIEEFEGVREISLGMSCPEAAKIILECKEKVEFVTHSDDEQEEYEEFDYLLYTKLLDARLILFEFIQNRIYPISNRMCAALQLSREMQKMIDSDQEFDLDELFLKDEEQLDDKLRTPNLQELYGEFENRFSYMQHLFGFMEKLEVLRSEWSDRVSQLKQILFGTSQENYEKLYHSFHQQYGKNSAQKEDWNCCMEQILVYFVYTYFCGAVYDDQVLAKMRFATVSTLLLEDMCIAIWKEQGETFSIENLIWIAHQYCREVEHSDENLDLMEQMVMKR